MIVSTLGYQLKPIGLCAYCVLNLNAANPARVGRKNFGFAADFEGSTITLRSGQRMLWKAGSEIPPGYDDIAELAMMFGTDASFETVGGFPLRMFAVTTVDGTMVCVEHAHARLMDTRRR